uniref:Capsid protein n=1 Tax=Dromedary picobirnavirus TaxID=1574421 RepID=A0A0A1EJA5_9VIRU|nr:capsid protein [Dromedary picobirnavirus]
MSNKSKKFSNQVPGNKGKPTGATKQSKSSNARKRKSGNRNNSNSKNTKADMRAVQFMERDTDVTVDQGNQGVNHISWYNAIPAVYQSAFSVATMPSLGWNIDYASYSTNISYHKDFDTIPGVMSIEFAPTVGRASSALDPINKVAEAIWKKFRTGITSNGWYEPADLMMYFMAADSIYMMWNHLKRAYGVAQWYDARNRYLPDALLRAMGFNPHDEYLTMHLPSLRLALNKIKAKMATFHVPADMTIMSRHSWLVSNVFADKDPSVTDMSQIYVFRPTYAYVAALGKLTSVPLGYGDTTMSVLETINTIENMIDMMGQHLDAIKFSAEVDRVYQGRICTLDDIEEGYELGIAYNPDLLCQVKNMTIVVDVNPGDIEQIVDNPETEDARSIIIQSISYELSDNPNIPKLSGAVLLNFRKAQPTNDDVCYATRLKFSSHRPAGNEKWEFTYGSEIVTNTYVWFYAETSAGYKLQCSNVQYNRKIMSGSATTFNDVVNDLHLTSAFDNYPNYELYYEVKSYTNASDYTDGALQGKYQFGSRENVALLTHAQLATMHEAALMSEFNYPSN